MEGVRVTRQTFDAQEGTVLKRVLATASLAVLLLLTACGAAPSATPPPRAERTVQRYEEQIQGLRDVLWSLGQSASAEPSVDVTSGLFLGRIVAVDTDEPAPSLDIDFVSAEMQPGLTTRQRQRSSWPRYFGWNKFRHVQTVRLSDSATVCSYGYDYQAVPLETFARDIERYDPDGELVWYVALDKGRAVVVWPWVP